MAVGRLMKIPLVKILAPAAILGALSSAAQTGERAADRLGPGKSARG